VTQTIFMCMVIFFFAAGVPDAPQLYIMDEIAEWRPVNPRGSDITTYHLEAEVGDSCF